MSLIFDSKSHTYTLDGVPLPSVTEITRFLSYDYKSNKPWLADAAAKRGTSIHESCMLIDYGEEPVQTHEIAGYLKAYCRFLQDYKPDWKLIEYPIGNIELGYAGTLDRYGILNGLHVVLDIKTGSVFRKRSLEAQLFGYSSLLFSANVPVQTTYGLRLDSSGIYELYEAGFDGYSTFTACMELHNALKKGKKK